MAKVGPGNAPLHPTRQGSRGPPGKDSCSSQEDGALRHPPPKAIRTVLRVHQVSVDQVDAPAAERHVRPLLSHFLERV